MRWELPQRRIRSEPIEGGMRYVLPPRRQPVQLIISLPLYMCATSAMVGAILTHDAEPILWIFIISSPFWLYRSLSQLVGYEVVTISSTGALRIQRRVLRFGPVQEYAPQMIRKLRVAPVAYGCFRSWELLPAFANGPIAFQYGEMTIRFGAGLDEADAHAVAHEIKRHYGL